ncbi:hypothetical protein BJ944DRAFT_244741 [Cunninghamella echinulata]|nr:hypothetical protein BJ944DRAFT_244741 [Cunninghamella echinulata]
MILSDIMNQSQPQPQPQSTSNFKKNKKPFRLVLDEPVLFIEDKPAMVRGEVIANMSHETHIQGPIEIVFEAIQIFYPWEEIMGDRSLVNPIQTKLQVIELSLLPPNSQGIIPAGIHRFPFEFPIPPTLPPTISIQNRLSIFYKLTANLKKTQQQPQHSHFNLLDWAKQSVSKKKMTDVSYLRLVRAIEGTPAAPAFILPTSSSPSSSALSLSSLTESSESLSSPSLPETPPIENNNSYQDLWSQYNNRLSIDEQHVQLVHSFGGRTADNLSKPLHELTKEKGVRYKLSVDRTAIALGTSVGLEVVLQPTQKKVKIKSIYMTIEESRKYQMKIPRQRNKGHPFETRRHTEAKKMLLKWAYAYPIPVDDCGYCYTKGLKIVGETKKNKTVLGDAYSHGIQHCHTLRQLEQPPHIQQKLRLPSSSPSSSYTSTTSSNNNNNSNRRSTVLGKHDISTTIISNLTALQTPPSPTATAVMDDKVSNPASDEKLLNLKVLDHTVELGDYFDGRFVLPVPPCGGLLNPSMDHDGLKIQHWLKMIVVLEQENDDGTRSLFEIALESPMHMLDCRLVSDDERQTILPPPPSYNEEDRLTQYDTFWAQRENITTMAQWGTCRRPCPCQIKQSLEDSQQQQKEKQQQKQKQEMKNNNKKIPHEFGAPPAYSQ